MRGSDFVEERHQVIEEVEALIDELQQVFGKGSECREQLERAIHEQRVTNQPLIEQLRTRLCHLWISVCPLDDCGLSWGLSSAICPVCIHFRKSR